MAVRRRPCGASMFARQCGGRPRAQAGGWRIQRIGVWQYAIGIKVNIGYEIHVLVEDTEDEAINSRDLEAASLDVSIF